MGSLLKALGVTIWGTIAVGLLLTIVLLGYRAVVKYRDLSAATTDSRNLESQPSGNGSVLRSGGADTDKPTQSQETSASGNTAIAIAAARTLIRTAADQHQYEVALSYGKQLVDNGSAGPDDLRIIAQTYDATNDCENAVTWSDRAIDASLAANREPDKSLQQIKTRCATAIPERHAYISVDQRERTMRLLNAMKQRAEADRKNLPQLEDEAARSATGNLDVALGEIYYGLGDYLNAIAAIQRGLGKGQVRHLDDAYVYLGRSQVAVGNNAEARLAFAKLKEVPDISPRILRLWELYAETLK